GSSRCLFDTSIIEPVGSRRSSAKELGADGARKAAGGKRLTRGHGPRPGLRLHLQELCDYGLVLRREDRAGRINEAPAGCEHPERGSEDLELSSAEGRDVPARLRSL